MISVQTGGGWEAPTAPHARTNRLFPRRIPHRIGAVRRLGTARTVHTHCRAARSLAGFWSVGRDGGEWIFRPRMAGVAGSQVASDLGIALLPEGGEVARDRDRAPRGRQ